MKRKTYRINEEYPSMGDIFQTKVGSKLRLLKFYRQTDTTVWLTDGERLFKRTPDQVQAVRIDRKLLLSHGFKPLETGGQSWEERLVLDCDGLHIEAYERADTMHIEITPEGSAQKTLVCSDFLHELQHLKRLRIAGITLPQLTGTGPVS